MKISSYRYKIRKKNNIIYYDIGLSILRPFLSFFVIMTHCYDIPKNQKAWKRLYQKADRFLFHVPIFFLMSFYFSYKTIISRNYGKQLKRIERLLIPYIIWPIISFFFNRILNRIIVTKIIYIYTFNDLKIQFLYGFGHSFNGVLWYQYDLILITICYFLIALLFKNNINFIIILISIVAFIKQYNGDNYRFCSKYKDKRYFGYGRIVEMIPFSAIGFLIASQGIMKYLRQFKLKTFLVLIFIIYTLNNYNIFSTLKNPHYDGIKLYLKSISIFICFAMFPSEKIKNKIFLKIIKKISNHTAGIYFLHQMVFRYIKEYFIIFKNKTLKGCIFLYLICYLICLFGAYFFGKTKLRHLFE